MIGSFLDGKSNGLCLKIHLIGVNQSNNTHNAIKLLVKKKSIKNQL